MRFYLRRKSECISKKNKLADLKQPLPVGFFHLEPLDLCQRVGLDYLPHVGLWVHQHEGQLGGQLAPHSAQEELDLDLGKRDTLHFFKNKNIIALFQDLCIPKKRQVNLLCFW